MCNHDSAAAQERIGRAREVMALQIAAGKIAEYGAFISTVCPDCDDFIDVGYVAGPAMGD